ncbi:MAG: nucleoside recognition domain-containing protein [Candidatus Saccharibacteria bacterium]
MTTRARLAHCVTSALPQGMRTVLWLLKLTIPVSFGVFLLNFFGLLNVIGTWLSPLFRMIGLPGQASVVLITSIFTNIYSVIAVMATLDFGLREGTIIAVMCLISHALIVETAIQKKTGSHPVRMVLTRLSGSFIAAWILNLLLPGESTTGAENVVNQAVAFMPALTDWALSMAITTLKIVVLANGLLILQKALDEFNLIKWILLPFRPFLKIMGLPANTGFLWMIAYTLGLSYGGAIMISQSEDGKLSREEADLLNHHIAISHSLLEDTLLFVAVGYSFMILFFTRVLLSIVYVWGRRMELQFRSRQWAVASDQ